MQQLKVVLLAFAILMINNVSGQDVNGPKQYNFYNFNSVEQSTNIINDIYTSNNFRQHPEYQTLPYNAPCTDCFEILDKRTANSRYFLKSDNPNKFYSQVAMGDLHYKDENGNLITIDPRLQPIEGKSGVYAATQQPIPTLLNLENGFTEMQLFDKSIMQFNTSNTLYYTNDLTQTGDVHHSNLNNYSVGFDGAYITNAFENIDQQLLFEAASVKTDYIINKLNDEAFNHTYMVIEESFVLPVGLKMSASPYEGYFLPNGLWTGEILVEDDKGTIYATVKKPFVYDQNQDENVVSSENFVGYGLNKNGNIYTLKIVINTTWLTADERIFPIVIDPTVYGTTTAWTGMAGSDETPNFCSMTLSVPAPAGATLTGSNIVWEMYAGGINCGSACKMNQLQVRLATSCGYSPGELSVWGCIGCAASGTWHAELDDATSASLVTCYETTCDPLNIDFTIYHNHFHCVVAGTCVTSCAYLKYYEVTVEGETFPEIEYCNAIDDDCDGVVDDGLEDSISITALGATTFCTGGSVDLIATYSGTSIQWKKNGVDIPGAISPTYTAAVKGNYTCVSYSLCDTVESAAITVFINKNPNAVITAAGPTTFCAGGSVTLNVTPVGGAAYQWYKGATAIAGATGTSYVATTNGNYKCRVTKVATGCFKNSNPISVSVPCKEGEILINDIEIYPNPADDVLMVNTNSNTLKSITILNNVGEQVKLLNHSGDVIEINIADLPAGLYVIEIRDGNFYYLNSFIKK